MAADIGIWGMEVMGRNLALNFDDHGYQVLVTNRSTEKIDRLLEGDGKESNVSGAYSVEQFIDGLASPRRIMLMVKAGKPVDLVIEQLLPHLDDGDIIIDGGNSNYQDTIRRTQELAAKNIRFIGCGVSGGEEGARYGPSLMPGGDVDGWPPIEEMFKAVAAKADDGRPCCEWLGADGAGHFVKMVHNGIEYGDMQLIAEAYDIMRNVLDMTANEMSAVFAKWNEGKLDSFLIEITSKILAFKAQDGSPLIDVILDAAGQKGTGKWTAINALEQGIPLTLIGEAVFARFLSALKDERVRASKQLPQIAPQSVDNRQQLLDDLREALYAAKIVSYAQGYMLLRAAAAEYGWDLDYGAIAAIWREGCIIRARFLNRITEAYEENPDLENLLLADYFKEQITAAEAAWRRTANRAINSAIPVPALTSALAFYDGYRREKLPANMIQAQRDFFGAHTYERLDQERGKKYHTDWVGDGTETAM